MISKKRRGIVSLLLACAMIISSIPMQSAAVSAEVVGTSDKWMTADDPKLRDYATPSASYVGWGEGPDNFADENMNSIWNGHNDPDLQNKNQWIMYDFGSRKAEISGSTLRYRDDGGGVMAPTNIIIEYMNDSGDWVEVTRTGEPWSFNKDSVNVYRFEPVVTSKIRITMKHAVLNNRKVAAAVSDWDLIGDIPADFPKPEAVPTETPSTDITSMPDVAVYAEPSSDYTSSWETVNGINNSAFEPSISDGGAGYGWGNWPQSPGSVHWLQYDWEEMITTKTFQVYWYGSNAGMKVPENVRFTYQDEAGRWKDVKILSDERNYSGFDRYNQITIEPVTTKTLRMYMTVPEGGDSNGVYRWKVYADVSDEFVVASAGHSLSIPEVIDGRVASRLRTKLTLPVSALNGKVSVSWKSKNPEVVSDNGTVTPPAKDTNVTLTATCRLKSNTAIVKDKDISFMVLSDKTIEYAMTIDQKNKGVDISQELIGVFYEDINSAADGGLSTEMVKNNSFENYQNLDSSEAPAVKGDQTSWKLHWNSSKPAGFTVERTEGLNSNNRNYAKITGEQQLLNHGFVEKYSMDKSAMAITEGKTYDFSMFVKAGSTYTGKVKVKVTDDAGIPLTNEAELEPVKDGTWQKVKTSLTATQTRLGTIVLSFEGANNSDAIYIDMVSLIPTDGYGYGNRNYSYGAGLRKDLVEKLQELNPSFIRFPGGCVVEGSYGTDGYYNWEDSIGPLEERRAIGSYWGTPGHPVEYMPGYGYMMSYQFGYHEILTLCEDLGAQAFPILSAGIFCQFRTTAQTVQGNDLEPFAKHATNLIDYCWGSPDSTNATQAAWAKKRVQNGHEKPFNLNYIGIGNENWEDLGKGETYYENFAWIKSYVEGYIEKNYPGRKITLISSTGPYYQGRQNTPAWNWINGTMPGGTLADEHYYINYAGDDDNTLLNGDYIYDSYKRLDEGGSNVFVGEYAGHLSSTRENVLDTAISEAAYMTGIERNADIVRHASYAPLFEREGCRDWDYNLIKFNAYESYGTPSYYVQTMFSNNYGSYIIDTTLEKYNSETSAYDEKPGHQMELYYVTSANESNIYTKLVNHDEYTKEITLSYPGIKDGAEVEVICLSGDAMDMNTMEDQTKVAPVVTKTAIHNETLAYKVPAMSFSIIKVQNLEKKPRVTEARLINSQDIELYWNQDVTGVGMGNDANFAITVDGSTYMTEEMVYYNKKTSIRLRNPIRKIEQMSEEEKLQSSQNLPDIKISMKGNCVKNAEGIYADAAVIAVEKYRPFYQKQRTLDCGVKVLGSETVSDSAMNKAKEMLEILLDNKEIAARMGGYGCMLGVYGEGNIAYDIPEHRYTYDENYLYVEGFGGTQLASIREANVLRVTEGSEATGYPDESVLVHEFAHTIKNYGLTDAQKETWTKIYRTSTGAGKWKDTYAGSNEDEYFATLSAIWFNVMDESMDGSVDGVRGQINTRAELYFYDREAYDFLASIYPGDKYLPQPWADKTVPNHFAYACSVKFFYEEGKEGRQKTVYLKTGEKLSASDIPVPQKEGYVFAGWKHEGKDFSISSTVTSDLELHANWTPKETEAPKGTEVPKETETPKETEVPKETETPKETEVPKETEAPKETEVPKKTETPKETEIPGNTNPSVKTFQKVKVKKPVISSLKRKGRKIAIVIKKISGAKGYQVIWAKDRKFKKSVKTKLIKTNKLTLKKMKRGTYYVKVTAYKPDSAGKKVFSKASKVKRIVIK